MLSASVAPIATNVGPINPASCLEFIAGGPVALSNQTAGVAQTEAARGPRAGEPARVVRRGPDTGRAFLPDRLPRDGGAPRQPHRKRSFRRCAAGSRPLP